LPDRVSEQIEAETVGGLLAADEPAPVLAERVEGASPFVFVSDHAGRRLPRALGDLGLDYLPLAALAKRAEEVYTPDRVHPLVLDLGSAGLRALQKIRDEAHRFALTYHTKLRGRRTLTSVLDQIPGVGPRLRTNLLRSLGSARAVREASVAELAAVPRVTPKLAQRIHAFFHPAPAGGEPAAGPERYAVQMQSPDGR
jgi:excinuclease ABC subunit C